MIIYITEKIESFRVMWANTVTILNTYFGQRALKRDLRAAAEMGIEGRRAMKHERVIVKKNN